MVGLCYPRWPNQAVSCSELPLFQSRSPECAHRKEHVKRPLCFQSGCTHIISWWYQPYHVNSIIISEPYSEQISMPKFYHIHIISKHVRNIFISFLFDQKQIHIISYHMHKNFNDIIFALLFILETCQILLMSTHFMSNISFLFHTYLMRECKTYTEVVFHFFFLKQHAHFYKPTSVHFFLCKSSIGTPLTWTS